MAKSQKACILEPGGPLAVSSGRSTPPSHKRGPPCRTRPMSYEFAQEAGGFFCFTIEARGSMREREPGRERGVGGNKRGSIRYWRVPERGKEGQEME